MRKQILSNDWAPLLEEEFTQPYYLRLREFLKQKSSHCLYFMGKRGTKKTKSDSYR